MLSKATREKAIEQNLAVLETRPNDLASIRNLAILYSDSGNYDSALQFAQRALGWSPKTRIGPRCKARSTSFRRSAAGKWDQKAKPHGTC